MDLPDVDRDPLRQLRAWLAAARSAGEPLAEKMALATVSPGGTPSVRMVILREVDSGLVFCTDAGSEKGTELAANPRVGAVLHWLHPIQRQVRVAGWAGQVSPEDSDRYWASYAEDARLAQAASYQDRVIETRAVVEAQLEEVRRQHAGAGSPAGARPGRWVGYRIVPQQVELWEEAPDRLHDRLRYRFENGEWAIERLSP